MTRVRLVGEMVEVPIAAGDEDADEDAAGGPTRLDVPRLRNLIQSLF